MSLKCRFYEDELPRVGDLVMVKVEGIQATGGDLSLLEYNSLVGMVLLSELSRRRIRSVNKLLRVGKNDIMVVIKVDSEKKYIDVSKRQVSLDEVASFEERYSNAKTVNQIMQRLSEELGHTTQEQLHDLCNKVSWFINRKYGKRCASFDVFKSAVKCPEVLDDCPVTEDVRERLLDILRHRMSSHACKIKSEFELSCFTFEGIIAIRYALLEGLKLSTDKLEIKINLISHPAFIMTCQTMARTEGLEALHNCLKVITGAIESRGGTFKLLKEPQVMNNHDEETNRNRIEQMNKANESDDEDTDDSEESGSEEDEED